MHNRGGGEALTLAQEDLAGRVESGRDREWNVKAVSTGNSFEETFYPEKSS